MSKARHAFFILPCAVLWLFLSANAGMSQAVEATIRVDPTNVSVGVTGRWLDARSAGQGSKLSFLTETIGVSELGDRISGLQLTESEGKPVGHKVFASGEFVANAGFSGWSYEYKAAVPPNPRASAHVTWLTDNSGVLMLDDLLPQTRGKTAIVTLDVPAGWKTVTTEKSIGPNKFDVKNVEKAVFVIGRGLRETTVNVGNTTLTVAASARWLFDDGEAAKIASEVFEEYVKIFGAGPAKDLQIVILPFPQKDAQNGAWEAETRGTTVTLVSGDMPFKTQSLQRLQEQLRHEIFHFWLPNGVEMTGNYDWFYEGFALYQSLKTGVALNQIRFEDYLDTLSRAHGIDAGQNRRLSLLEASKNRLNGSETQVYARGMLAAFLCDVTLLKASNGNRSITDVFRQLQRSHKPPAEAVDANTAIFTLLRQFPELADITERYIKGPQKVEWAALLQSAGIEDEPGNTRTNLRVMTKLNGRQKALLDKLGYNSWRKLARKP